MMNTAYEYAKHKAAILRRSGYPDAVASREYCVDEIGPDNFYTLTASVYVGEYKPETNHDLFRRATAKAMAK